MKLGYLSGHLDGHTSRPLIVAVIVCAFDFDWFNVFFEWQLKYTSLMKVLYITRNSIICD